MLCLVALLARWYQLASGEEICESTGRPRASGGPLYTPLPCAVAMSNPADFLMGQMDDVFWISAVGGMRAEDTVADLTVFQAGHRSEAWAHWALRTAE